MMIRILPSLSKNSKHTDPVRITDNLFLRLKYEVPMCRWGWWCTARACPWARPPSTWLVTTCCRAPPPFSPSWRWLPRYRALVCQYANVLFGQRFSWGNSDLLLQLDLDPINFRSWIRIRIRVKSWIRIRIPVKIEPFKLCRWVLAARVVNPDPHESALFLEAGSGSGTAWEWKMDRNLH